MKKTILSAIIFLQVFSVHAQITFGPQAGLNVATLEDTKLDVKTKAGIHGGLFLNIGFGKHISIMPEALYSMKGFKYEYQTFSSSTTVTNGDTVTYNLNLNAGVDATLGYLDIPILLTVFTGDHAGLMFQAGPQVSYLITGKADVTSTATATMTTNGGTPQTTDPKIRQEVKLNKTDIALIGGIGYKFPKLLIVFLRASTGLAKVQQSGDLVDDENRGKNFVFEAGLALNFGAK